MNTKEVGNAKLTSIPFFPGSSLLMLITELACNTRLDKPLHNPLNFHFSRRNEMSSRSITNNYCGKRMRPYLPSPASYNSCAVQDLLRLAYRLATISYNKELPRSVIQIVTSFPGYPASMW